MKKINEKWKKLKGYDRWFLISTQKDYNPLIVYLYCNFKEVYWIPRIAKINLDNFGYNPNMSYEDDDIVNYVIRKDLSEPITKRIKAIKYIKKFIKDNLDLSPENILSNVLWGDNKN